MLLSIKNDVHLALARGEATAVVLLDQPAVFDMIDHGILLDCLSSWFGVGGVVLDWFKFYLSEHTHVVRLDLSCLMPRSSCLVCSGLYPRFYTHFLLCYSPQQSNSK